MSIDETEVSISIMSSTMADETDDKFNSDIKMTKVKTNLKKEIKRSLSSLFLFEKHFTDKLKLEAQD